MAGAGRCCGCGWGTTLTFLLRRVLLRCPVAGEAAFLMRREVLVSVASHQKGGFCNYRLRRSGHPRGRKSDPG